MHITVYRFKKKAVDLAIDIYVYKYVAFIFFQYKLIKVFNFDDECSIKFRNNKFP